jgi:hypothetical protein
VSRVEEVVKRNAYKFLSELQQELTDRLPVAAAMRASIRTIMAASKIEHSKKHLRQPEYVFLNHYAIPIISIAMQKVDGIGPEEAQNSLLCEFYRNMPQYCRTTAARTVKSPFIKKYLEADALEIIQAWKEGKLERGCPDFAFADPFPYKIVFEGKYFERGSSQKAAVELVTNVRQAFFYHALPYVSAGAGRLAWDYDFSCLMACDASEDGSLYAAWNDLPKHVRSAFWEGANLYVMIIRANQGWSVAEGDNNAHNAS